MSKSKSKKVIVLGAGGGHLTEALMAIDGVPMDRVIATYCLPHTKASLTGENIYCAFKMIMEEKKSKTKEEKK